MFSGQLHVLGVRIDVGSRYGFSGWPCPAIPSWALDPSGWELAAQLGFSRDLVDLQGAEVYWLSTARPDGRPHVTPVLGVWLDGALYFCTGPAERKAKNLAQNPNCVLTTGCNGLDGLDLVVEGAAAKVSDGGSVGAVAQPGTRWLV
jgi:hypothetical protein